MNKLEDKKDNAQKLQRYLDIAGSFIISLNKAQKITYINQRGAEILERDVQDVLGHDYFELCVEEEIREISRTRFLKLFKLPLQRPNNFEGKVLTASGKERVINWTNSALRNEKNEIVEIISSGNDITWRMNAIRKLLESEEKYKALIEATDTGYSIVDRSGKIIEANQKYVELTGYKSVEEIKDKFVVSFIAKYHTQKYEDNLNFCLKHDSVRHFEIDLITKAGDIIPVQMSSNAVEKEGEINVITLCRDISERKRIEHEAKLHEQQLIQADKMASLGVLVSGVAHEINNPNNFVMLNIPILQGMWDHMKPIMDNHWEENGDFLMGKRLRYSTIRDSVPELLGAIYEGSKRIENIVRELKDYARQKDDDWQIINLNEVVKTAYLLTENLLKSSTNNFVIELQQQLPAMKGSFQKLEQVIINLLENSCQAITDKSESIKIITKYDIENETIICQICDEGIGMTQETLKQIRDPFFTTKRTRGGTGLGLAVSSKIVATHQGSLEFASKPNRGTCAELRFPIYSLKGE